MKLSSFFQMTAPEIAQLMRADGPKVCACPINGTRRWFILEHASQIEAENEARYLRIMLGKYIEIFNLLFSHGVDTILTPIFGPDLLTRGDAYMEMAVQGMKDLVTDEEFRAFVKANQVRVRFYGDYVRYFQGTRFEFLLDLFQQLTAETLHFSRYRLFWGVVGNDATEQVAQMGAEYYMREKRFPARREIIEAYYGEFVAPVSLFIGYDKFSAFDMPLLATGQEDLYFMTSPTPYLTERQLRLILFDHLYSRKGEPDYAEFTPQDWARMRHFYQTNQENTMGIGLNLHGVWYPLAQVTGTEKLLLDEFSTL